MIIPCQEFSESSTEESLVHAGRTGMVTSGRETIIMVIVAIIIIALGKGATGLLWLTYWSNISYFKHFFNIPQVENQANFTEKSIQAAEVGVIYFKCSDSDGDCVLIGSLPPSSSLYSPPVGSSTTSLTPSLLRTLKRR